MTMLGALLLLLAAAPVDTCRFDLPGVMRRSPDGSQAVRPLYSRATADSLGLYAGWLFLAPGALLPEHEHDEDEMLWVVCGSSRFRLGDGELALAPGSAVRIPKKTQHAALAGAEGLVAVQIYRPGGAARPYDGWTEVKEPPE